MNAAASVPAAAIAVRCRAPLFPLLVPADQPRKNAAGGPAGHQSSQALQA